MNWKSFRTLRHNTKTSLNTTYASSHKKPIIFTTCKLNHFLTFSYPCTKEFTKNTNTNSNNTNNNKNIHNMQPKFLLFLFLFMFMYKFFSFSCYASSIVSVCSEFHLNHNHTDKKQTKVCVLLFGNMRKNSITKFTQISKILCAILILIWCGESI